MSEASVHKILERIYEYGVEPQIIQDMNLSQDALFHVYSRLEEASLQGVSLSLADVFEIIFSTLKV